MPGKDHEKVYFGATVVVTKRRANERTISIVGNRTNRSNRRRVSWISPIATACWGLGR